MNQGIRRLAVAATLLGALLAPATGAFASEHGGQHGRHHGRGHPHHVAQKVHQQKVFLGGHKLEGEAVIVSVASDGSSMVLRPTNSDVVTATVTISSSTVITSDEGVTTTTLAAGERVHVVVVEVGGAKVAQLVVIESAAASGDVTGGHDDHGSKGGHGGEHHGPFQFEGVIVSVATDGSSMVLQRPNSPNVTATITISSSTVITADEGVTTTTLAAGEQVHVKAQQQADGTFVATWIEIQKPEANGDHNPGGSTGDGDHGQGGNGNPGNAGSGNGSGHGDHQGGPGAGDDDGNSGGHNTGGSGPGGA